MEEGNKITVEGDERIPAVIQSLNDKLVAMDKPVIVVGVGQEKPYYEGPAKEGFVIKLWEGAQIGSTAKPLWEELAAIRNKAAVAK